MNRPTLSGEGQLDRWRADLPVDLSDIHQTRAAILYDVDQLEGVQPDLVHRHFADALQQELQHFEELLLSGHWLVITLPKMQPVSMGRYRALLSEYEIDESEDMYVALIPTERVTGTDVLIRECGSTRNPTVCLRVQTQSDPVIHLLDPQTIKPVAEASPGSWYGFMLKDSEFAVL